MCEVDINHLTFLSPITRRNFVEAHHLIPISSQEKFEYSLDVPGNIISLCPNCHREIHHGKIFNKKEMIQLLYNKRNESLKLFGITIDLDKLVNVYLK